MKGPFYHIGEIIVERVIVGIMVVFMLIGVVDKAMLKSRFGYGDEFEKGLETIGPLTIMMGGIMCGAPLLGKALSRYLTSVFNVFGSDPGMVGGIFLALDMGAYPLVQTITSSKDVLLLSGVLMGATLGGTISFIIPVGLNFCSKEERPYAIKGIVAAIIASPISAIVGGLAANIPIKVIIVNMLPIILVAFVLGLLFAFIQELTIQFFLLFSRLLYAACILLLGIAITEMLLGFKLIPGMAPLGEQLKLIGVIGCTLAGAYPLVKFIQKKLIRFIKKIGKILRIDDAAAIGLLISLANPLPTFSVIKQMSPRGIMLVFAFCPAATTVFGDHLGFITAVDRTAIIPMILGKLSAGFLGLVLAIVFEDVTNKKQKWAKKMETAEN